MSSRNVIGGGRQCVCFNILMSGVLSEHKPFEKTRSVKVGVI